MQGRFRFETVLEFSLTKGPSRAVLLLVVAASAVERSGGRISEIKHDSFIAMGPDCCPYFFIGHALPYTCP